MRAGPRGLVLAGLAVAGIGGAAPAEDIARTYLSKADLAAAAARAAASVQPGHGTASRPLMALGDYTAKIEYHVGPNIANAHEGQAELFQALDGSGTLVTGGTVVKTGAASTITGGTARHVAAGDIFIVPEGVPHWFSQVDGHLTMVSIMLPRPAAIPAQKP